jgi:hypothetical protein
MPPQHPLRRIFSLFGWTRHSLYIFSAFVFVCGLIIYVWWPLAEEVLAYIDWTGAWWLYFDWLLVGVWLAMSLLIMAKANLKVDAKIVFVGAVGGLVIEAWGTQTNLWHYYTAERPPLWIIPAWPIAALSTDRLVRALDMLLPSTRRASRILQIAYWLIFIPFLGSMLVFVTPTLDKSFTLLALALCVLLIFSPTEPRRAALTFVAGAGLGYFLELWGTTRECWTYYTLQTPPFFAVLAHGMASVAFWRAGRLLDWLIQQKAARTVL